MKAFHLAGCEKMVGPPDSGCLPHCPERLIQERDEARGGEHERAHPSMSTNVLTGIRLAPDEAFEQAGGFDFVDELAVALDRKWRDVGGPGSPIPVSVTDLAWLIEGYARARGASGAAS